MYLNTDNQFVDNNKNVIDFKTGIKQLRKQHSLNTTQFGDKLGVGRRAVEAWEQGVNKPSKSAVILLKQIFNL
jgi:DNA-binding transcriptional regulator YiaG